MTTEREFPEPMTSFDSDARNVGNGMGQSHAEPIESRTAASTEPEDTATIFSRMGIKVDVEEDVDTTEEACRDVTPDRVMTEPTSDDADDAVVAEYMQRLLGRSSGSSNTPAPSSKSTSHSSSTGRTRATSSTSATTPSNGMSNTVHNRAARQPRQPRKPRPTTVPESSCDLAAMRELANLSARGALDMHSRRRLTQDTFTKLLVVGLALAAGISMALNASVVGGYAWVGASVCWTISVVWGAQYLCLFRLCYGRGRRDKTHSGGGDVKNAETADADTAPHTRSDD